VPRGCTEVDESSAATHFDESTDVGHTHLELERRRYTIKDLEAVRGRILLVLVQIDEPGRVRLCACSRMQANP